MFLGCIKGKQSATQGSASGSGSIDLANIQWGKYFSDLTSFNDACHTEAIATDTFKSDVPATFTAV